MKKNTVVCLVMFLFTFVLNINSTHAFQFCDCGPSGGTGGRFFSDGHKTGRATIAEVRIRSGRFIDSIQVIYYYGGKVDQEVPGTIHGGNGGDLDTFKLDDDEYITAIGGKYGKYVDSLWIRTNKGRSKKWGRGGGVVDFHFYAPPGTRINGFFGRSGKYLDAIGVIIRTHN